jgi:hypothetical protein
MPAGDSRGRAARPQHRARGWYRRHWEHAIGLTGWQRAAIGWPAYDVPFTDSIWPGMTRAQELQEAGLERTT